MRKNRKIKQQKRKISKGNKIGILAWILIFTAWILLGMLAHGSERVPELYAQAAVLMDANSGRVLYGKNADQIMAMASTTKIMTCIIALEKGNLEDRAAVSAYAASMPQVKLGVRKGEVYVLKDLLYSLMLESHNDAAVVIAEHVGKQYLEEDIKTKSTADFTEEESKKAVAAFAALMNEKARSLGCEDTWFITPNGLDAWESVLQENGEYAERFHSTTAAELAFIMSYCIQVSPKKEEFLEITQTPSYTFSADNGRDFACYNHNAFLNMMSGALSGKTGFTNRAGYCYVGALEDGGRTYVVALLACGWPNNKNYKWSDTRKLMTYGMEHYYYRSFTDGDTIWEQKWLQPVLVENGQTVLLGETAYVPVEIRETEDENIQGLLMKAGEEIAVEYTRPDFLAAPVYKGSVVGCIQYMVDGVVYRREEIVTTENVEKIDLEWCAWQVCKRFLLNF